MKVPKARKLPSGVWFIQLRLDGKSIPITAPTASECELQATLYKAKWKAGQLTVQDPRSQTLEELLTDYIASKSNVLSPSTIRGYESIKRTRFAPIMRKKISSVRSWQSVVNDEAKLCSAKSLKNAWALVSSALKAQGIAAKVTLPAVPKNERPYLNPDECLKFIAGVKGKECEIPALLALHSLRRSEILALDWKNIDLEKRDIYVRGATVFDADQKLVDKPTNKTEGSTRHVPILSDALYEALSAVSEKVGKVVGINPNTLWAQINRVCEANELPKVGVHGLRHSFASLAYHLGFSEAETMIIGGWEDINTMRKIYTHIPKSVLSNSASKMADFLNQSR